MHFLACRAVDYPKGSWFQPQLKQIRYLHATINSVTAPAPLTALLAMLDPLRPPSVTKLPSISRLTLHLCLSGSEALCTPTSRNEDLKVKN
jgi:hypothetical protein